MKLTKNQIDALYRVALAEHFTSPSERAHYDVAAALKALERKGAIRHDGRFILTDSGRTALDELLRGAQAATLANVRDRRAARTGGAS